MRIIAIPQQYIEKEQLYFDVRNKEKRIITDEALRKLPDTDNANPHKKEWDIRAGNFKKFLKYISGKKRQLTILDIGCGNGWMTHKLNQQGHHTIGIDLNMTELLQAEKVFGTSDTLQWIYADIMTDAIPVNNNDVILFGASCQYFSDIEQLIIKASEYLKPSGEIHFIDSIFYTDTHQAKVRSDAYYLQLGFPEMSKYYHHHTIAKLKNVGFRKKAPGFFDKSVLQWWYYTKK